MVGSCLLCFPDRNLAALFANAPKETRNGSVGDWGVRSEMGHAREVYSSIRELFQGDLLLPGDAAYEASRGIWNGMFDRRPGLIARCADVSDVQTAIRAASSAGLLTAVRCGGHSLAGFSTCDDGMVLDLSRLRQVTVDPEA